MLQTIVFFIALCSSVTYLEATLLDCINKNGEYKQVRAVSIIISCISWSILFYLKT